MPDILLCGEKRDSFNSVSSSLFESSHIDCGVCSYDNLVKLAMLHRCDFIVIQDDDEVRLKRHIHILRENLSNPNAIIIYLAGNITSTDISRLTEEDDINYAFKWSEATETLSEHILNCYFHEKNVARKNDEGAAKPCPDNWSFSLSLSDTALRNHDPVTEIIETICRYSNINQHQKILYVIFIELYNNAVEHGVLELDSKIKNQTASGFEDYYKIKQDAISTLNTGTLDITIKHVPNSESGELHITMKDSGNGFNYKEVLKQKTQTSIDPYGRGISLICELCDVVDYSGNGNTVKAVYLL